MKTNFKSGGQDFGDYFVNKQFLRETNVWVMGFNSVGGLGNGTPATNAYTMVTLPASYQWKELSQGDDIGVGIRTDGTMWGWGYNGYGNIGDLTRVNKSSPVQIIAGGAGWRTLSVARGPGGNHAGAINNAGQMWTWGLGTSGQLGDGTTASKSSPIQVSGGGNDWVKVSCVITSTFAQKRDGTIWGWGVNTNGFLGTGDTANKTVPTLSAGGRKDFRGLCTTRNCVFVLSPDNYIWMWGDGNHTNSVSNNTTASTPVQMSFGNNWKQIAACGGGSDVMGGIKNDNTLWMWGYNWIGCIGQGGTAGYQGGTAFYSSPMQVTLGNSSWKFVEVGGASPNIGNNCGVVAIATDGTLWSWGAAAFSNDGVGTGGYTSPRQINTRTNWKSANMGTDVVSMFEYI